MPTMYEHVGWISMALHACYSVLPIQKKSPNECTCRGDASHNHEVAMATPKALKLYRLALNNLFKPPKNILDITEHRHKHILRLKDRSQVAV